MPSTGRSSCAARGASFKVVCILPGSIRPTVATDPRAYPRIVPAPIVTTSLAASWGPIRLAASPGGLVAVEQLTSRDEFDERLTRRFGTPPTALDDPSANPPAAAHLRRSAAAFERFLAGELGGPRRPAHRPGGPDGLGPRRPGAVRTIRAGSTASYGEVARMVGKPGAARAVGGAVGRNPSGSSIPCHRVIAGDGTLGGYGGGWWGGRAGRARAEDASCSRARACTSAHIARNTELGRPAVDRLAGMFAIFRKRDFTPHVAGPARLDDRLVADRPRRGHPRLPAHRLGAERRPRADGRPRSRPCSSACSRACSSTASTGRGSSSPRTSCAAGSCS